MAGAKAKWVEFSDSFIKLVFICPECGKEITINLDEYRKVGDPYCYECGKETITEFKTVKVFM